MGYNSRVMNERIHTTQYMDFVLVKDTGKTKVVKIVNKRSNAILGSIQWYGNWRQYVFLPNSDCIFNTGCLDDIQHVIKMLMDERKKN